MKILHINKFHYLRGGSELVYFDTVRLLEEQHHYSVFFSMRHPKNLPCKELVYFVSHAELDSNDGNIFEKTKIALRILYSWEAKRKIERLLDKEKPDIAHLHNIHHQISPSIIHSLKKFNVPVVMTLHDYKMSCASYSMLCRQKVCEACKGRRYYRCFLEKCVKNSKTKSLLSTLEMYLHHKIFGIYDLVDIFISPSLFLKDKLAEMGFKGKIEHIPNFVNLENFSPSYVWQENSIVYFGRLSSEKGLVTLLNSMAGINARLKLIGEGPLRQALEAEAKRMGMENIEFLGYKNGNELKEIVAKSMFVVLPSECYENNPRSVIESFALGKPVIGSAIGGIPELVRNGFSGLLFKTGDAVDLRQKIEYLLTNKEKAEQMGKNARYFAEREFSPLSHYEKLMKVYRSVRE